ncbi:N-acetylmuramic acid 6-phosphate etherase [Microbacterium sediminis]|uniref:N-acetylmuramic acid 6-phosphate etherase n=1 Tax=Microbacterium sediminis TaxID=904291 RepID=A0A1B9NG71_9MICO|nr:N-acetylmuramic acid 6-phosphate etherase [Microbacterium sediminis]OCG75580.1 N-acetylmuramic acid 6-phosphate etherase [Microbacterium sediminis]QBR73978.1 N-acetylmuramic acid 6-phosphate etherase [Microbacterium sediminis]
MRSELPPTERRLPESMELDSTDTLGVLRLLHEQDTVAVQALEPLLPRIAALVDEAADRMRRGGRVHYFGAGTSGRLGVLDAAELLPTYNIPPGRVVPHIAGGDAAIVNAVENAEDSRAEGAAAAAEVGPDDVAIGLTASGTTPYVAAALEAARAKGAFTALVSSNPASPIGREVDIDLPLDTGAEVITGSTRLKAGTAQKLVLNGFSTALMVALGRTWSNLMVSVVATNDKLRDRSVRILCDATGLGPDAARDALAAAGGDVKVALVAHLLGVTADAAAERLEETGGSVRDAIR